MAPGTPRLGGPSSKIPQVDPATRTVRDGSRFGTARPCAPRMTRSRRMWARPMAWSPSRRPARIRVPSPLPGGTSARGGPAVATISWFGPTADGAAMHGPARARPPIPPPAEGRGGPDRGGRAHGPRGRRRWRRRRGRRRAGPGDEAPRLGAGGRRRRPPRRHGSAPRRRRAGGRPRRPGGGGPADRLAIGGKDGAMRIGAVERAQAVDGDRRRRPRSTAAGRVSLGPSGGPRSPGAERTQWRAPSGWWRRPRPGERALRAARW